ncbi:glycosyltransferase family 8 protein [Phanerochaete carnosa HHB-10118-sp]|uniref:Glycosyltransferase family 8 protein n=1 Tax=Phanerochaete carnosa (strain HHB-10118-sp) TaxID=650164 RepID=K5WJF6_PHACS|nr:glycosyltransferase family 8 protein [Phanerochaete carnosa HHB-10118-sp]EKM59540.1 glycosyltransferase family 8 protein [Phanerochaete carnosa HHB-10118-sp]
MVSSHTWERYGRSLAAPQSADTVNGLLLASSESAATGCTDANYVFTPTQDWFSFNEDRWRSLFPLVKSTAPRALEIGSWEGRSAVFLLTELCARGGSLTCIDHFDLMQTAAGRERYEKVVRNLSMTGKPFRVMEGFSTPMLMTILQEEMTAIQPGFDWIYVDGSHEADDTFLDAEMAWRLARKGAVIIFDDYRWDKEPEDSDHHPKRGIDTFMTLHAAQFDVISSPTEYQMILQKKSEMRIGFLVKGATSPETPIYHDLHIVLTIDSAFAMPAAVAIQSILSQTTGRITLYIVDLGLSSSDRARLRRLAAADSPLDVTMVFLSLPEDDPLGGMGPTWAKIAMIPQTVLPVERVLYLDADVLVRADLRALWNTDLGGKPIGATADVGHPMGHADVERGPYFNAGVLLLDLAKVRAVLRELFDACRQRKDSLHRDQDALNVVFRDEWHPLDLKWNAQGLGTYADSVSVDRDAMDVAAMKADPAVVHFTGPVNPGMAEVLNPYVQPYTSKPWGYAGAPGHPFAGEWWSALETTDWRGWRGSTEYSEYCVQKREDAERAGVDAFQQRIGGSRA